MGDKGAYAQPLVLLQDVPHFGIARADARKVVGFVAMKAGLPAFFTDTLMLSLSPSGYR
jgi:hypothetical protein